MRQGAQLAVKPLSHASPTPLYYQLAVSIEEAIEAGTLTGGMDLPTEGQVAAQMHLSRNTVRGAWLYLEKNGLIVRKQGYGTIIC